MQQQCRHCKNGRSGSTCSRRRSYLERWNPPKALAGRRSFGPASVSVSVEKDAASVRRSMGSDLQVGHTPMPVRTRAHKHSDVCTVFLPKHIIISALYRLCRALPRLKEQRGKKGADKKKNKRSVDVQSGEVHQYKAICWENNHTNQRYLNWFRRKMAPDIRSLSRKSCTYIKMWICSVKNTDSVMCYEQISDFSMSIDNIRWFLSTRFLQCDLRKSSIWGSSSLLLGRLS